MIVFFPVCRSCWYSWNIWSCSYKKLQPI